MVHDASLMGGLKPTAGIQPANQSTANVRPDTQGPQQAQARMTAPQPQAVSPSASVAMPFIDPMKVLSGNWNLIQGMIAGFNVQGLNTKTTQKPLISEVSGTQGSDVDADSEEREQAKNAGTRVPPVFGKHYATDEEMFPESPFNQLV